MCVRVCDIEFVVFTDCESCTRPISTNPESMEAREDGLTRGTCFLARSLEAVAFAGLLRLSWCVVGGVDVFVFFSRLFFFFKHTRPTASMRTPCLIYLSTSRNRALVWYNLHGPLGARLISPHMGLRVIFVDMARSPTKITLYFCVPRV